MFAVVFAAFSVLVILALVSGAFYFAMRIRLMRVDTARDRIGWLSFHSSDDVLAAYATLFPRSLLPRFCRFVFWMVIVIGAIGLCATITLRVLVR
jgi:hypothetical protein